ncbi:sigma-70 family RNA polymerase sigma factor [Brevundimonas sp. Bb-A]|uniref:sigma-70 family RNA polymerase sigma factor n=1 Tax=Brevundimonas sp. Bb-A TaxID=2560058 RepID=UPI00128EAF3B|nr:sigma-70 family RNA polymerase sigma factor [Brevundimonas sp. Bb-A]QFU31579.1 putative RNA polymerase sigma factor FecI [Brevundimonas sp. Bb-A]
MSVQDLGAGRLLAKNAVRLRAFVRSRVHNDEDADDISQEAYARVLARSQTAPLKDPVAYAFRVALNLLSDRRRVASPSAGEAIDEAAASDAPSPFEVLDMKQRADLFTRALQRMPRLRREVFVLRQSADLSYAEIATRLNISVEAAQKHFSRAAVEVRRAVDMERTR